MSETKNRTVYDRNGNAYTLTGKIGEGGQGGVYTTDRRGVLVKLINTKNPQSIARWRKQLDWSKRQNLAGLNLALPKIEIEKPRAGYVLELMDGLISLHQVLQSSYKDLLDNKSVEEYLATGGIRRRLKLLLAIADIMADLQSRGFAYGDLSATNIFVSENPQDSQVWLIDCDNLSCNEKEGYTQLYTPGYGAPEIVKGVGLTNCQTDAWSFAVVAFVLLTMQHPLCGAKVVLRPPQFEEQALRGELPWIYDTQDCSNASTGGLSLGMVSNDKLKALFHRCFEKGKTNPLARPTAANWANELQMALDQLIDCHDCGHQFFYREEQHQQTCPFCDTVASEGTFIVFEQQLFENEQTHDLGNLRVLNSGGHLTFKAVAYGTQLWQEATPAISISWREDRLHFLTVEKSKMCIYRGEKGFEFEMEKRLPLNKRHPDKPFWFTAWPISAEDDPAYLAVIKSYRWQFT